MTDPDKPPEEPKYLWWRDCTCTLEICLDSCPMCKQLPDEFACPRDHSYGETGIAQVAVLQQLLDEWTYGPAGDRVATELAIRRLIAHIEGSDQDDKEDEDDEDDDEDAEIGTEFDEELPHVIVAGDGQQHRYQLARADCGQHATPHLLKVWRLDRDNTWLWVMMIGLDEDDGDAETITQIPGEQPPMAEATRQANAHVDAAREAGLWRLTFDDDE